nr:LTA synthase family protein [Bacteroidota bacterium]
NTKRKIIRYFMLVAFFITLLSSVNYLRVSIGINEWAVHFLRDNQLISLTLAVLLIASFIFLIYHLSHFLKVMYVFLLIISPFALINFAQTSWKLGLESVAQPNIKSRQIQNVNKNTQKESNRVVVLIFDELDQVLTFLDRPDNVDLPAFDKFRKQSVFAENSEETSGATQDAIPSMLTGRLLKETKILSRKELLIQRVNSDEFEKISESSTLFSEAASKGYAIGIAGYYLPYCRLFAGHYNKCTALSMGTTQVIKDQDLQEIMIDQLYSMVPNYRRRNARKTLDYLSKELSVLSVDAGLDLVYGHVSVPHGPNIYDRKNEKFTYFNTQPEGYFGNLVLADKFLEKIRLEMEKHGLWESSTVIVTSDHGWRHVKLINRERDYRVPFLVKLPSQTKNVIYKPNFSSTVLKELILNLLGGEISNTEEVINFLNLNKD